MEKFTIRPFRKKDLKDLEEITYKTGDFGEDLTGKGWFNDSRLFFCLYIYYYLIFVPEHAFVAVVNQSASTGGVVRFCAHVSARILCFILTSVGTPGSPRT